MFVGSALVAVQFASGVTLPWHGWSEKVWDETWSLTEQRCPAQMQAFMAEHPGFPDGIAQEIVAPNWDNFNLAMTDLLVDDATQTSWREAMGFVFVAGAQVGSSIRYTAYLRNGEVEAPAKTGAELWRIAKTDLEAAKCLALPESVEAALLSSVWTRDSGEDMDDLRKLLACTDWFAANDRLLAIPPEDAMASDMSERLEVALGSVTRKCGRGLN